MAWNYSGDPSNNSRDKVRFLVGDTCKDDPQVTDEEIAFALDNQPSEELAAALVCHGLASRYSRLVTVKVGDVSNNCGELAKAYKARADELDPFGQVFGAAALVIPSFGGLSKSEKETLDDDTDAVQPLFYKGMNDIPGGPDNLGPGWDELKS